MNNPFSKENLKKGLSFYNIDIQYIIDGVLSASEELAKDKDFFDKIVEIRSFIFNDESIEWKLMNENIRPVVFGEKHFPYLAAMILISGYDIHKSNLEKYKYDEDQYVKSVNSVKACFDLTIIKKGLDDINFTYLSWGKCFTKAMIIKVGNLQYEKKIDQFGDPYITIHIPRANKLDIDEVKKSLKDASFQIEKYFGLANIPYKCTSWLLCPQLKDCLKEGSNILKFQNLFDIEAKGSALSGIFSFVFDTSVTDDYDSLPGNTSLQRNLKEGLKKGIVYYSGTGTVKTEFLNN